MSSKGKIPFWIILLLGIISLVAVDYVNQKREAINLEKNSLPTLSTNVADADGTFQPDVLRIKVAEKTYQKLLQQTKDAWEVGILIATDEHWVTGELESKKEAKKIPVKLRLKGDWLDHLRGKKWSLRIQAKSDYAWNRLVTFSVQNPATRSYLDEWIFHQFLTDADILSPRYDFIQVFLNNEDLGVYAYEEHFDKQLAEFKKRREGPILKLTEDLVWLGHHRQVKELGEKIHLSGREDAAYDAAEIRPFKEGRTQESPLLAKQFQAGQTLLHQFKHKLKSPSEIVDIDLFARYLAMADLMKAYHGIGWHNIRFYYNPVTSKLEPIGYDGYGELETSYHGGPFIGYKINFDRHPHDYFKYLFTDQNFFKKYIAYLDAYTQPEFLEKKMEGYFSPLAERQSFIQKEFKKYSFDSLKIIDRGKKLQAIIRPYGEHNLTVRTEKSQTGPLNLMVANNHTLPIEVVGFGKKADKLRDKLNQPVFVYSTPKFYAADFVKIPANYDVKYVFYRVAGLTEIYTSPVVNWKVPSSATTAQQLFENVELKSNAVYSVNGQKILFQKGKHTIDKDIVIPENYSVLFEAGCQLDFIKKAAFISKSAIEIKGTMEEPVLIHSSDQTANGFTVIGAKEKSFLSFARFENLNTLQRAQWSLTGAVNFYESQVDIRQCAFLKNHCEDALNIIRSEFNLIDSKIADTFADGFDADFCEGKIENLTISDTGNDAIDFSGSWINISKIDIHRAGDKGISVGEEAHINVTSAYINGAVIGVASKDLSVLKIDLVNMVNCQQGFAAYQKKPEFGPARIEVKRYGAEKVERLYLLDKNSKLLLIDKEIVGE